MTVEVSPDNPLFVKITHTASGAEATVSLIGATVISFITAAKNELIFMSRLAKLDGSKAIRGGIPLCFPQFGQPDTSMPQHGFLRANKWQLGASSENNEFLMCEFKLSLTDDMRDRGGRWSPNGDYKCSVVLTIKIDAYSITSSLEAKNIGDVSIENCQVLFHTYYQIEGSKATDKSICYVEGLNGYDVIDKSPGPEEPPSFVEKGNQVFVYKEIDRVFFNPSKPDLDIIISTGGSTKVHLQASGSMNGSKVPTSVVVWNPYIEKAKSLGDFGDEQYHEMLCVEPGILNQQNILLEVGKSLSFEQIIKSI